MLSCCVYEVYSSKSRMQNKPNSAKGALSAGTAWAKIAMDPSKAYLVRVHLQLHIV